MLSSLSNLTMERLRNYFPKYPIKKSGVVNIEERPPVLQCIVLGFQHILSMFGSSILVPSYVGSSFAFIGVVISATNYVYVPGGGRNEHMDVATGGILMCGLALGLIGLIVMFFGSDWVESVMPPVVTGSVVITIGIHLSTSALENAARTTVDAWVAFVTVITVVLVSVYAPGIFKRIPVLIGMIVGYLAYFIAGKMGYGSIIDYSKVNEAHWVAVPNFTTPKFEAKAISTIVPVCIVLLAENLGHVKAVGATAETSLDKYIGRAILGDAFATIVSSAGGGPGTTTYAENIGVMAVTKNFSTLVFLVAAVIAICLSWIEKLGAVILTIPQGVFGGLSVVLFGLVAVSGARIWVENKVDFKDSRTMLIAGVPIIIGAGIHSTLEWGYFQLDGIGLSTYTAIILNQVLRRWSDVFPCAKSKKQQKTSSESNAEAAHPAV
ncbi:putative pyrimidine permease RutG [Pseudolycoriella hygida]|uniref:Pyrimidine permease RutG n=1 Tax=Pseudolycoriella hygida TaxID=35572 RepID=A0A9Q0NDF9_9DIPT|nr:putative pyrimidine permease RutG [Pseudolycoriella hygida]